MIGETALHKAGRKSFAPPCTSANCVIARLHPQLSHLCGEGFQSVSDDGSRYILQRESVLFLYTTPSNRFIIVSSASSRRTISTPFILHIPCSHVPIIHLGSLHHVVTVFRERAQGSVAQGSVAQPSYRVWLCFGVVKPG